MPAYIAAFDDRHPVVRLTVRKNLRFMTGKHFPRRSMYEDYWREFGDRVDFGDPEEKIKELDRSGYDTRRYIQEILKGTDIVVVLGKWDKVEIDGRLEDHDCAIRYSKDGRDLAVATLFRDHESLEAELEMETETGPTPSTPAVPTSLRYD